MDENDKRVWWASILVTLGATVIFLGITAVWSLFLVSKEPYYPYQVIIILVGIGLFFWGICWSPQFKIMTRRPSAEITLTDGVHVEVYKDVKHTIIPGKEGFYYVGQHCNFKVRMINTLNSPVQRDFVYFMQLPGGLIVERIQRNINLSGNESKIIDLSPEIFLGFIGILRIVLLIGTDEQSFLANGTMNPNYRFITLYVSNVRDREEHRIQLSMLQLTRRLSWLTILLIILSAVLAIPPLHSLLNSSNGPRSAPIVAPHHFNRTK